MLRKYDLLEPTGREKPSHDGHDHDHEHDHEHEHDGRALVRLQVPRSE